MFTKKTKHLIERIDKFLNLVNETSIIFLMSLSDYLNNDLKSFQSRLDKVVECEREADEIRRDVEINLYTYTLIPESRGDVLAILENTDDVIDIMKETLLSFYAENPDIPSNIHTKFKEMLELSNKAVDSLVRAVRAFFTEVYQVSEHLNKVHVYETQIDLIGADLVKNVFDSDLELSQKQHLRFFIKNVENISDYSESVADRLAIYAIKRRI